MREFSNRPYWEIAYSKKLRNQIMWLETILFSSLKPVSQFHASLRPTYNCNMFDVCGTLPTPSV